MLYLYGGYSKAKDEEDPDLEHGRVCDDMWALDLGTCQARGTVFRLLSVDRSYRRGCALGDVCDNMWALDLNACQARAAR